MKVFLKISALIDRISGIVGHLFAWFIVAAVVVSAGNAVIRKSFSISSNAWLELQWYLFGAAFMLCASWTLRDDGHVRVDVLSQNLSPRTRVWIDLICHILFLMPFAILMVYLSWPFFMTSFLSGEQSNNAGGLVRWPAKLWVLLGFSLFAAQGVSEIIKKLAMLTGARPIPDEHADPAPGEPGTAGGGHFG